MPALSTLLPTRYRRTGAAAAALDLPALVGAAGWARLPAAVQRRFGNAHADTSYLGRMDLHCSRIGRVYAWLARLVGGPLPRIDATAVPTTVNVSRNGHGGVVWERRFHGGAAQAGCTVRSTKEIDAGGGLLERTDGGLSMALDVFEEEGSLVFRSSRYWLVLGALRLPIPALLTPGVCRVTHTDLGQGLFRFTLSMAHPLWGQTFHQSGVFADPCESTS